MSMQNRPENRDEPRRERYHLKGKNPEELINELEEQMEGMTDLSFNEGLVRAYLDELELKEPMVSDLDVEASLSRFHAAHNKQDESRLPSHRRKIFMRIPAVAAAIMMCMLIAQAAGADVFGAIARWSNDIFQFTPYAVSETPPVPLQFPSGEETTFDSLQDALYALNLNIKIVPAWLPDKFTLNKVTLRRIDDLISVDASYLADDGSFLGIMFEQQWSSTTFSVFEKDDGEVVPYEKDGTTYYIMTNNAQVTAAWLCSNYECAIWGNVTKEEMIRIIESID